MHTFVCTTDHAAIYASAIAAMHAPSHATMDTVMLAAVCEIVDAIYQATTYAICEANQATMHECDDATAGHFHATMHVPVRAAVPEAMQVAVDETVSKFCMH